MAAATVPNSFFSMATSTRDSTSSVRGAGSKFAQLVSRFEILDAVSNLDKSPKSSKSFAQSCSNLSSVARRQPADKAVKSKETTDSSSDWSSQISPGQQLSPTRRSRSLRKRKSSTPVPTVQSASSRLFRVCSRHKSVAERRKMFESKEEAGDPLISVRSSAEDSSPLKASPSKSWQTIQSEAPEDDGFSTTSSSPIDGSEERYLSGTTGCLPKSQPRQLSPARSIGLSLAELSEKSLALRGRSKNHDDADKARAGRGWNLPPIDTSGKIYAHSSPKISSTTAQEFLAKPVVQSGFKMTSTPRSLKAISNFTSSIPRPVSKQHGKSAETSPSPRCCNNQKPGQQAANQLSNSTSGNSSITRSRISSLRKIFDFPKSATAPLALLTSHKKDDQASVNTSSPARLLRDERSTPTPNSDLSTPTKPKTGSWASERTRRLFHSPSSSVKAKIDSPLRDKIGLFESLAGEGSGPIRDEATTTHHRKHSLDRYRQKLSGAGKSLPFKAAFRRISRSWSRSSSEKGSQDHEPISQQYDDGGDAWWLDRGTKPIKKAPTSRLTKSPSAGSGSPRKEHGQSRYKSASRPKQHGFQIDGAVSMPSSQIDHESRVFKILGSGGHNQQIGASNAKNGVLKERRLGNYHATMDLKSPQRLSRSDPTPIEDHEQLVSTTHLRHRISRSGAPLVANAVCSLEQPKPVRANELRRLVSLCKDKVARRISGSHGVER